MFLWTLRKRLCEFEFGCRITPCLSSDILEKIMNKIYIKMYIYIYKKALCINLHKIQLQLDIYRSIGSARHVNPSCHLQLGTLEFCWQMYKSDLWKAMKLHWRVQIGRKSGSWVHNHSVYQVMFTQFTVFYWLWGQWSQTITFQMLVVVKQRLL